MSHPVIVIGGGLAGLTAAAFLKRHGIPVRLMESSSVIAGLCGSDRDAEGFTYDCGPHFITNRLAAAVGCSATCEHMARYGETVHYRGKSYAYPFGLLSSPRFVASAIVSRLGTFFQQTPTTALEHYSRKYGSAIAREIALPLTKAWSGYDGTELAASVGQKFVTSMLRTMYLVAMKPLRRRALGIGYSGTFPEATSVWHVYPQGGVRAVCETIAQPIREDIVVNSPVEAIQCDQQGVRGVTVRGEFLPASAVVSTAPVHVLAKIIQGSNQLDYLKRFEYRAMVFVNLRLQGSSNLPDVVTWAPEERFPFFRVSDIGMGLPFLVPCGKTQITCDIGCTVGDDMRNAADEDLAQLCLASLESISPGIGAKYLGCRIVRTPLAYPIFRKEYEADRVRFKQGTGISRLVSVGRNGEFDHILMEDVYWRTRRKMIDLASILTDCDANQFLPRKVA